MGQSSNTIKIAPSILSADFCCLESEIKSVETADFIHFDVMDGHFVPNHTFGPDILKAARRATDLPLDVHLMISNPDLLAIEYARVGADIVTIHIEATNHAHRVIHALKDMGVKAGIALNPATPLSAIEEVVQDVDLVLVMTVNPGFGGQVFIENSIDKLVRLRALLEKKSLAPLIEVDGGIGKTTAERVCSAGATVLAAGSSVFGAPNRARAIEELRQLGLYGLSYEV